MLKLSDGAITHVSTVSGAIAAAGGEDATSNTGAADLGSAGEGPGAGTKTYVVVASEDGAVRFYDLKFRVEVSAARYSLARYSTTRYVLGFSAQEHNGP